jgi:membrane-associated phospholipid phosphatase
MMNVNRPRVVRHSAARPRITESRSAQIALAVAAATGVVWLAQGLEFDRPTRLDRRVRRLARGASMDGARLVLSPLFPIGLPGAYITVAHATSHWLGRRRKRGGSAIVSAAWLGWLVQRAIKVGYRRERPLRPDVRRRTDSYPSGHTTGTTALALTLALVLRREGLISTRRAAAIAIGAPAIMGAYRVIADDHWATDVVGGWMLGGAIALACGASR